MSATDELTTLDKFIADNRITATAVRHYDNPWMSDATDGMHHWRVTLKCGRKRLTVPFSQGSAHTKEPIAADVLDCMASDAAGYENARSFEEWCSEYGYDEDSRRAEKTYKAVEQSSAKLSKFLGQEQYEQLVWRTERL